MPEIARKKAKMEDFMFKKTIDTIDIVSDKEIPKRVIKMVKELARIDEDFLSDLRTIEISNNIVSIYQSDPFDENSMVKLTVTLQDFINCRIDDKIISCEIVRKS